MPQEIDLQSIENDVLGRGVEFAGIINRKGRVIDYLYENKISLSQEQRDMFFMETSLSLRMQDDYDDNFGPVRYIVTERENFTIVSIPIPNGLMILFVNKGTSLPLLVKKILRSVHSMKSENISFAGT